ncbi:MAG: phenylacetate--CoA ligase family protein [Acidimicrobiales bacterium]
MSASGVVYQNRETECLPRDELVTRQLTRLRDQLSYVSERSPFYRQKLRGAGIAPGDIRTMDDLRRIPPTVKEELRASQAAHPPWGDFGCIGPEAAVRVFQTSGTTGKPVRIMLNRTDWFENFFEQFSYYRCAFGLTEKDVLFVPFNYGLYIAWWGFQAAMEKAGLMIIPGGGQSSKDRLQAMIDWGATVVCGTPSYLLRLCQIARASGIDLVNSPITKLIAAGEPGAAVLATRKTMENEWGAELFDDIGSTEISNFGYECVMHDGTHVNEAMFIAEVLDPQTLEPVADGQVGELVLTNLCCESMPLIRYRMMDLVKFDRSTCACGRTSVRLAGGILGRSDDVFHFAGVNIFPTQIQNLLHQIDELSKEYQVVVPEMGSGRHLTIRVEPANDRVDAATLKRAVDHLVETVKYRITVTPEVEIVDIGAIPRGEGKAKRVLREKAGVRT